MTREQLILSLSPQVNQAVRRLQESLPRQVTADDLIGHAWLGAIFAVDHYKPNMGVELGAYAYSRIRGAMLDYLRSLDTATRDERKKERKTGVELHRAHVALVFPDGEPRELQVPTPDHTAPLDQTKLMERILAVLQPREALAVKLYYWDDLTMRTIASMLGINESRVCQVLALARKRMHRAATA